MPLGQGYRNVPLRRNLVSYLMDKWTDKKERDPERTNKEFGGYINDLLDKLIQKDKYVLQEYPTMSVFGVQDDVMYIQDTRIVGRFVDIRIKNGKLYCDYDKDDCCDHIFFANTQNEVSCIRQHDSNNNNNGKGKLATVILP